MRDVVGGVACNRNIGEISHLDHGVNFLFSPELRESRLTGITWDVRNSLQEIKYILYTTTVIIGYYDYLGTRPKNIHRPISVTGQ